MKSGSAPNNQVLRLKAVKNVILQIYVYARIQNTVRVFAK
jgi:hypothetical protein